jgi:hypothetical protein
MAPTISIMVHALPGKDPIPTFLYEQNGAWQDLKSGDLAISTSEMQQRLGENLNVIMQSAENNPGQSVMASLVNATAKLYEQLLPEKLRDVIGHAAATAAPDDPPILRIHLATTKFDWVPWELLRDDRDYLGVSFQIARLPVGQTLPAIDEQQPREVKAIHNILGQTVLDATQAPLKAVWQDTFVPPCGVVHKLIPANGAPPWPTIDDVIAAFKADVLHLTCHGMYDESGKSYFWAIDPDNQLGALAGVGTDTFANVRPIGGRPLLFANACAFTGKQIGLVPGFGRELFARGIQNAVGAFARVSKTVAIPFAKSFYQRLLDDGDSIGRALVLTKREFHQHATDPSPLFYCLYGPPGTRFKYP